MTTRLSYNGSITGTASYLTQVSTLAVVPPTDTNFLAILPAMITYAVVGVQSSASNASQDFDMPILPGGAAGGVAGLPGIVFAALAVVGVQALDTIATANFGASPFVNPTPAGYATFDSMAT